MYERRWQSLVVTVHKSREYGAKIARRKSNTDTSVIMRGREPGFSASKWLAGPEIHVRWAVNVTVQKWHGCIGPELDVLALSLFSIVTKLILILKGDWREGNSCAICRHANLLSGRNAERWEPFPVQPNTRHNALAFAVRLTPFSVQAGDR